MKLQNVVFSDRNKAIYGEIEFVYDPVDSKKDKWLDIVSLKNSDKESAFVFRINQESGFFQTYFGDGVKLHGNFKIDVDNFLGRVSLLKYWRGRDFTFFSISNGDVCLVRFAMHKNKVAFNVPASRYKEGGRAGGVDVKRIGFTNLPADDISLAAAEELILNSTGVIKDSDYYDSLNNLGVAFFSLKNFDKSLSLFEVVSCASSKNAHKVVFTRARTCINRLYGPSDRGKAWRRFSSQEDSIFGKVRETVFSSSQRELTVDFKTAVDKLFTSPPYEFSDEEKNLLTDGFESLLKGARGEQPNEIPSISPTKVAIVSGMGWSGSGAVYDYLREFSEVVPIKGETPYIEGAESLRMIYASLSDDEKLKKRIFDFFFYALVGHGFYRGGGDFKLFGHARKKMMGEGAFEYLTSVRDWCLVASSVLAEKGEQRDYFFSLLSDLTISRFSVGESIPEGMIALLDNVVHISNSHQCINFLSGATLFCTFRDPRSNYVALVREAAHFNSDAKDYINNKKNEYQKNLKTVEAAIDIAKGARNKEVEVVQFEEFVLSEKYRERLASRLGLNMSGHKKHLYFKPWESMRNVVLHQEHPDQSEIRLIENELNQYCVEPCVSYHNKHNRCD